jgi:hypothetical protein
LAKTSAPSAAIRPAEEDALGSGDELQQRLPPLLDAVLPDVCSFEAQKVECDITGSLAAAPRQERLEIAVSVRAEHDGLAIDQGLVSALRQSRTPASGGEAYFRARNGMTAMARTPVVPEGTHAGPLSAHLRRSLIGTGGDGLARQPRTDERQVIDSNR